MDGAEEELNLKSAKWICWGFFIFGAAATIMVNLAYVPSGWGPKLTSVIAPISVLGVVEILARVPFPKKFWWSFSKYSILTIVGVSALFASYWHMAHLFLRYEEDTAVAWILPVVPDGMMVISALGMIALSNMRDHRIAEQERKKAEAEQSAKALAEREEAEQSELDELKKYMDEHSQELESKTQELESRISDLDLRETEIDNLKAELEMSSSDAHSSQGMISSQRERIAELQEQLRIEQSIQRTNEWDIDSLRPYELSNRARQMVLDSITNDNVYPTAAEVATKFGRSEKWGSNRIIEVEREVQNTQNPVSMS